MFYPSSHTIYYYIISINFSRKIKRRRQARTSESIRWQAMIRGQVMPVFVPIYIGRGIYFCVHGNDDVR